MIEQAGGLSPWAVFGGITALVKASAARTGSFGLELSGGSSSSGVFRDVTGLVPGQNYEISAWVRRPSGMGTAWLWLNDTTLASTSDLLPAPGTAQYTRLHLDFRATSTAAIRIHLVYNGAPGTVEWDDIEVRALLENGFESGSLPPWIVFGGATATVSGSAARSGPFGLEMSGGGGVAGVWRDITGLTAGKLYEIVAWVRRPSGSGTPWLWAHDTTGANSGFVPGPSAASFHPLKLYYRANMTGALRLHLFYDGQPGSVHWDDILVRETETIEQGFESGALPPWHPFGGAVVQVAAAARTGIYGLEISGGGSLTGVLSDIAGLTPGKNYEVRAWVRRTTGSGTPWLWVHDTTGANSVALPGPAALGYQQVKLDYRANATGALRLHLAYDGQPGAVQWDDLVVQEKTTIDQGFESGSLPPWLPFGGTVVQVTGVAARSGAFGLEMSGGSGVAGILYDVTGLTPGQNYDVSAWVRRQSGSGVPWLWVHDTTGANSTFLPGPAATVFGEVKLNYQANGSAAMRLHLFYDGQPGAVHWDDVSVAGP